jgi:hypothetical protein
MPDEIPEEIPSVTIQEQYPDIDEEPLAETLEDVPPDLAKEKCTTTTKERPAAIPRKKRPGVRVSRELLEMAGFTEHQQIYNLTIK